LLIYSDADVGPTFVLKAANSETARRTSCRRIGDFDVTREGEIVFDRRRGNSDIALIELQER